jgi:hypothetical protein
MEERKAKLDAAEDSARNWTRIYWAVVLWTLLTIAAIGIFSIWSY